MYSSSANPAVTHSLRRWWILPAAFITYSLAYLDRANFGFGAAAGMAKTLGITEGRNSLLGALFFFGYFALQIPGAQLARRISATRLVFYTLLAWGVFAMLTGVIRNFWLLALDRTLLGIAESVVFPATLVLMTQWFTRAERSRANTLLILGNPTTVLWMSALTGWLIQRLGWQKTFILEGLPSLLWALVWVAFVRDRPSEASWVPKEDAEAFEETLASEQVSLFRTSPAAGEGILLTGDPPSLRQTLLRSDVLVLSVQYFAWSLGVYGFVLWLPAIVHRAGDSLLRGMTMSSTGLLSAIPYLLAIVLMLLVGYLSDRSQRRRELVWPFLLLSGAAMFGSFLLADHSVPLAFACLVLAGGCMYAPYGPFFAIIPERIPRERTAEVLAMVNSAGALGGFAGSYAVGLLRALTGSEKAGFALMAGALVLSSLLILLLPPAPEGPSLAAETAPRPAHA